MALAQRPDAKRRPVYLDLPRIRLPLPGFVSILHRASGALLFLVGIPALLWGVEASLTSPEAYAAFSAFMAHAIAKLVAIALAWAYLHHLFAGIRHLLLDVHVGLELKAARLSATVVLVAALLLTLMLAVRLW
jgi:succinate dehydrogenase / fumarate reductase cytochrome b subunit